LNAFQEKIRKSGWLILSVMVHILLLGAILLAPLPDAVADKPDPAENLDRERLKQAAEMLKKINEPELEYHIKELKEIHEAMAEIHEKRVEDLKEFMQDKPHQAMEELIPLVRRIIEGQEQSLGELALIGSSANTVVSTWEQTLTLEAHLDLVNKGFPTLQSEIKELEDVQGAWKAISQNVSSIRRDQTRAIELLEWAGLKELGLAQQDVSIEQGRSGYNASLWHEYSYQTDRLFGKVDQAFRRKEITPKKDRYNTMIRNGRNAYAEIYSRYGKISESVQKAYASQGKSLTAEQAILTALLSLDLEKDLPEQIPADLKVLGEMGFDSRLDEKMDYADQLDQQINQMHEEISAIELSRRADIPFSQALDSTQMDETGNDQNPEIQPSTPEASDVSTGQEFNEYRTALEDALVNTRNKVDDASSKLAHASELNREAESGVDVAALFSETREQAKGEGAGVISDLTRPPVEGRHANSDGTSGQGHGPSAMPSFLTHHAGDGKGGADFDAVAGYGLAQTGSETAPWLGLNRWYIIGPFDTAKGTLANRVFPPEHQVDLDERYSGADGRQLTWNYVHSPGTVIGVPDLRTFSIYYAYTEIRLESAKELWIAAASDDAGKMWINDKLVWVGTYNPKDVPWSFENSLKMKGQRPAYFNHKGFRKMRLEAGVHRILFRVENTGGGCAFSVYLRNSPGPS